MANDSALTNKRLGIKVPRSILLPPYLALNDYYVDFTNAIDSVFGTMVDAKINVLANIRNMWVQNPTTEAAVQAGKLIDSSSWSSFEREIVVKQVNMLGMKLQNAGVVTDAAYQQISRFVGQYWFGKGTQTFIEFINYCLGSNLVIVNQWTQNYVNFYPEGDPTIGTPIWEGGTWYPTTNVVIEAAGGLQGQDINTIAAFFYEIANYNLVLQSIDQSFNIPFVVDPISGDRAFVAIGAYMVSQISIANSIGTGAPSPLVNTLPNHGIPTTYFAMGGVPATISTSQLLAQPSGWLFLTGGQKVPVYGLSAQGPTNAGYIGTHLMGPAVSGSYNLLYGPVTWIPIPGSPLSPARLPAYGVGTYTVIDGHSIPAAMVGESRDFLLVNPTGFFEVNPGQFVPYW